MIYALFGFVSPPEMTIRQISDVALGAFGPGVYKRAIQAMGLDLEYFNYKDCSSGIEAVASEKGKELDARPSSGAQPVPHRRSRRQWQNSKFPAAV